MLDVQLSIAEAARLTGISNTSVQALVDAGALPATSRRHKGNKRLIPFKAVYALGTVVELSRRIPMGTDWRALPKAVGWLLNEDVTEHLREGRRFLILNRTRCWIGTADTVLQATGDGGPSCFAVADLKRGLERFTKAVQDLKKSVFEPEAMEVSA